MALKCQKLHSEKATKFEKKNPICFDVTYYVNVETSGIFFSNFVAFSENLNFKDFSNLLEIEI